MKWKKILVGIQYGSHVIITTSGHEPLAKDFTPSVNIAKDFTPSVNIKEKTMTLQEFFEKRMQHSDDLIIIKFGAAWCGPCASLTSVFDKIWSQDEFKNIPIIHVDVDEDPEIVSLFNIKSVPTVFVAKGDINQTIIGFKPETYWIDLFRNILSK